jgi:putative restriction endonuclease
VATKEAWLGKFAQLRVDRASGDPAPHKPLLLLVILELAEQGLLPQEILPLTPELAFRFSSYWGIVTERRKQRPDVRYPFYYLKSDGFWSPLAEDGQPAIDRKQTRYARMPSDFVAFAKDAASREHARRILIARYFLASERVGLYALTGLPVPTDDAVKADANFKSPEDSQKRGREARFRIRVMAAYNYTCALTCYRLTTISGKSIVDAAHIHQFADSRNNDPRNGMALSKNAHWLFDNGLWTLTDAYRVITAEGHFDEAGTTHRLLRECHGQKILLPGDPNLWPNPVHIAWHRNKRFRKM